jgi:hypothetical protein
MRLGDEWLSTSPTAAAVHWSQVLLPLDPPLLLREGDRLNLELQRPPHGDWVWKTRTAQQQQQGSTFFSVAPALEKLHKRADHYVPQANELAQAAIYALSRFDGHANLGSIAAALLSRWPAKFKDVEDALRFVRALVQRYA